jgi:antiviral helicase SKI2
MTQRIRRELSNRFPVDSSQLLASLGLDAVPSREQTYREIEERLLLPRDRLPEDWLSKYQVWVRSSFPLCSSVDLLSRHWDGQISIPSLLSLKPSPPPTSISFIRSGLSGHVTGYSEVTLSSLVHERVYSYTVVTGCEPPDSNWLDFYIFRQTPRTKR